MNSSGMKRGLAATAISALAVTGLPFLASSASADSYLDQLGNAETRLYTQYSGNGSVQNDGTNTTVHLLSGGGEDVVQVRFEYTADDTAGTPVWTAISTVSRSNGGFSAEWAPPTGIYNLSTVSVRAVALNSVGTEIGTADSAPVTVGSAQPAVDIANAAGSNVPTFLQPYTTETMTGRLGVISGKTSDVSGGATVDVSNLTTGAPTGTNAATLAPAAGGTRAFEGVVDFTGYNFDTTAPIVNEAVVGAESGSDDAELVTLSNQTITTVTAAAEPTTVQDPQTATGVVTVTDANGAPIAGAQVFRDADNDGIWDGAVAEPFKYTDTNGEAEFPGLAGSPTGTQHVFIVNTTDGDDYAAADDFRRTVTVTSYDPTATTIAANSADGAQFDVDEYDAAPGANGEGDLTVTVKDQNGNNLPGETVLGTVTFTPFGGTAAAPAPVAITDGDNDGVYNIAFVNLGDGTYTYNLRIERDGTPGQSAGDLSAAPLTVKAGESELVWADGEVAQAPAGSTATFEGTIQLADGTALPNRNVAFSWVKNATGNAVVAAQAAQPSGTTRVGDTSATGTADGSGHFGVAISDPAATPNVDELGGQLDVNSANTPAYGTNNDNSSTPALTVDFLADAAVSSDAGDTSTAQSNLGGAAAPGRPVRVSINVENAAGEDLTDLPVTITTDHGFFTTPNATDMSDLKADPAAADGANYGEWENLGTERSTTTDDNGDAWAVVAIERDAGFDDDGRVTANVKFEVGGKSFTEAVVFDSSNPMNPGEVRIVLDDNQTVEDATLPNAPTTETLKWDVEATDQFGNLTDVTVALSDNGSAADLSANSVTSNFSGQAPALTTSSDVGADQVVTGTWTADTLVWNDSNDALAGFQGDPALDNNPATMDSTDGTADKTVTGESQEINWYEIDFAASTYTLTHNGGETQPVGTTVTMTYKAVDQHGEPIQGLDVDFFRTGPDNNHTGGIDGSGTTNGNGQTFYVFQGETPGDATVTTVAYEGGSIIPQGEQTEVVTFAGAVPSADVELKGKNNGSRADRLKADAIDAAAGAEVVLQKKTKNGWKKVASGVLNSMGNKRFKVADKNGNKFTKYRAVVKADGDVTGDRDTKRVR